MDYSPKHLDIDDNMQDDNIFDKENNDPVIFKLQNLKVYRKKGKLSDTKWFKLIHEASKVKTNQCWYKKCRITGHYQKNCRVVYFFIIIYIISLSFILEWQGNINIYRL